MTLSFFHSISEVATSDGYHSTVHPFNNNSELESVLLQIEKTIKDCGNSIDAYYKQKRMSKISVLLPWFHRTHDVQSNSTRLKNGKPA